MKKRILLICALLSFCLLSACGAVEDTDAFICYGDWSAVSYLVEGEETGNSSSISIDKDGGCYSEANEFLFYMEVDETRSESPDEQVYFRLCDENHVSLTEGSMYVTYTVCYFPPTGQLMIAWLGDMKIHKIYYEKV